MLGLTDGLSLLILRSCEPLEDTLIAALRDDNEIKKNVLYNSVQDLPVTLAHIKIRAGKDIFINEKTKQVRWKLNKQNKKGFP